MQMGKALYRKYRSKSLDEIVGQPHITTTLDNALKSGAISHAYLFTGPRGTGKTSIARILAHQVNSLPYEPDATHLDIIEIDAASNRRIDEIRELRERVHSAPTSAKYKVYIIDEVHMLTKEAFNALLKTLEEPPAHVIFILATTEAHKLPETIVSRTQRFTFKPVDEAQVIEHLRHIAKQEDLILDDEALQLIAQHGGGSFRDSISLLDQLRGYGKKVSLNDVRGMLGIAPQQAIDQLVSLLQSSNPGGLLEVLNDLKAQGYQAGQLAKQLAKQLRSYLITGVSPLPVELVTETLQKLLAVPASHDQDASLEIALLDIVLRNKPDSTEPAKLASNSPPPEPVKIAEVKAPKKPEETSVEKKSTPEPNDNSTSDQSDETWDQILETIKKTHNTLYSVARMAKPHFKDGELTLSFHFAFHQKRLSETKNKQIMARIVEDVAGKPYTIICITDGKTKAAATPLAASAATIDTFSNISNIFGGAEMLES